jgi:HRDC domain-containing protein
MRHRDSVTPRQRRATRDEIDVSGSLLDVLRRWREGLYQRREFSTFSDPELGAIAQSVPRDAGALQAALHSETKAAKYAGELLDLIGRKLVHDGTGPRGRHGD